VDEPRRRGWSREPSKRRGRLVATVAVLAAIAVVMVIGTIRGDGLSDPVLWIGLALVPLLLVLARRAGLG
jgi:Ni/Fe-hydrogenase subunit HybB-like protein